VERAGERVKGEEGEGKGKWEKGGGWRWGKNRRTTRKGGEGKQAGKKGRRKWTEGGEVNDGWGPAQSRISRGEKGSFPHAGGGEGGKTLGPACVKV